MLMEKVPERNRSLFQSYVGSLISVPKSGGASTERSPTVGRTSHLGEIKPLSKGRMLFALVLPRFHQGPLN